MPKDAAYHARTDNILYISDSVEEGNTTAANAASWVKNGSSKYINNDNGKPTWVTHPDWHSHTWLTPDEWEKCLKDPKVELTAGADPEYYALLAAMRSLESGGLEVRVICWFDN